MRTKFSGILTLVLALVVQLTFAQQKTITGTVTDESNIPLPGVNVIVKGTTNGTQTDFDGNYSINASVGQTLVYSYLSYKTTERAIGANASKISLSMEPDASLLNEVVVTGFAIKKEKKALGYSVSSIQAEDITENPQSDLTRVLSGKAAGINITAQNGTSGSANRVIIRGLTSFSGDNNALYVIDGVPISNDTNESGDFVDGNMGSSRSFDIDPNNVERIDILKGLAAATLYGTEGRNGVILITTKTGSTSNRSRKQEIEISSSVFVNEVSGLPDYQNKYGGGFDQKFGWFYSNWGPGFYEEGLGGYGNDPLISEDATVTHPYASSAFLRNNYRDIWESYAGETYDWKPRNSVEEFFRKGIATNLSISTRGTSDDGKFGYGMIFSHLDEDGYTPGNNVKRNNLTVAGNGDLSNKVKVRASLTYTKTDLITPPIAASFGSSIFGNGSSIFGDLIYTPRNIDFFELPFELPDGSTIYYRDDNAIQHPLWTVKNTRFSQRVNRLNGFASIGFDLTDFLNISYTGSIDTYAEKTENRQNKGGVSDDVSVQSGFLRTSFTTNTIFDHRVVLNTSSLKFLNDSFSFSGTLGATSKSTTYDTSGLYSDGQVVFGFFDSSGFLNSTPFKTFTDGTVLDLEHHTRRNIVGVFGQVLLDYENYAFLNVSGRNDWVSNANNNSLFYPSASLSLVPTSMFEGLRSDNGVNYLKLRVGYGTSANFAPDYPVDETLILRTASFLINGEEDVVTNSTNRRRANPDIKPELFEEVEFGIETKLFNRLTMDLSYFKRTTNDLIVDSPVPASTGAEYTITNIGEYKTTGVEADLGLDIIKTKTNGFAWRVNVNYSQLDSEVTDLGSDNDIIIYAGFTNLGNGAQVGYPITAFYGSRVARDENGNKLVNSIGNYVSEDVDENGVIPYIGDSNPDFIMNYSTTFSWKGFGLNVALNHTSGGDIYSSTVATLLGRGLTTDTEDRLGTYILEGVSQDTGEPNQIQINNSNFYFDNGFASTAQDLSVYDASVVRLQEVSLSYSLPAKYMENTPLGSLRIKVSGYNMWYNAYNMPEGTNFDPNTSSLGAGNGSGFEYLTGPSSKRYGVSVNATF